MSYPSVKRRFHNIMFIYNGLYCRGTTQIPFAKLSAVKLGHEFLFFRLLYL